MNYSKILILTFLSLLISQFAFAEEPLQFIVKIKKSALSESTLSGVDISGVDLKKRTIDIILNMNQIDALKRMSIPFTIVAAKDLKKRNGLLIEKEYHTPEEIVDEVKKATTLAPQFVQSYVIGNSLKGKPLYGVRITDLNIKTPKTVVYFDGMHHAREIMTTEVTTDIIKTLVTGAMNNSQVKELLQKVEVWVIPQVNPDGNEIVWTKDNWWRKNARTDSGSTYGVDPNRNYPFMWGGKCKGSSNSKSSQTFHGASALSEPESMTVFKLAKKINPIASISFHSYSEVLIGPELCVDAPDMKTVNAFGKTIADLIPLDSDASKAYTYGPNSRSTIGYDVDGDQASALYQENGTLAYVLEMNQEFQPDYKKYRDLTVNKLRKAWFNMIQLAANGPQVRGTFKDENTGQNLGGSVYIKGENYRNYQTGRKITNGFYNKILVPGDYTLIFNSVGYVAKEVKVKVGNAPLELPITLKKSR